jgi:large subunit ribosomal protein L29
MTKAQVFKEQTDEQLEANLEDLKKELYQLRSEYALTKKLEKPHRVNESRKDIARILTILSERQQAKGE